MKVAIAFQLIAIGIAFSEAIGVGLDASLGGGLNIGLGSSHSLAGVNYGGHKEGAIAAGLSSGAEQNSFSYSKVGSASTGLDVGLGVGLGGISIAGHKTASHDHSVASGGSFGLSSSTAHINGASASENYGGSQGQIGGNSAESSSSAKAGVSWGIGAGSSTKANGFINQVHKGHSVNGFRHTTSAAASSSGAAGHSNRHFHGHKNKHIHEHRHGHSDKSYTSGGNSKEFGPQIISNDSSDSGDHIDKNHGYVNSGTVLSGTSGSSIRDRMSSHSSSHRTSYGGSHKSYNHGNKAGFNAGRAGHSSSTLNLSNEKSGFMYSAGISGGSSTKKYSTASNSGFSITGSKDSQHRDQQGSLAGDVTSLNYPSSLPVTTRDESSFTSSLVSSSSASKGSSLDIGAEVGLGVADGDLRLSTSTPSYSGSFTNENKHISGYGAGKVYSGSSGDIAVSTSVGGLESTGLVNHVGSQVDGSHSITASSANSATSGSAEATGLLSGLLGIQGNVSGYKNSASSHASAGGYSSNHEGSFAGASASSSGTTGGLSLGLGLGLGR